MNRNIQLWLLAAFSLATVCSAHAQQSGKIPRIGFLSAAGISTLSSTRTEAFRQGLRELGYVEEKNIVIEWRYVEGKPEQIHSLAADLVRLKVDIIVTAGPTPTRAAKGATAAIPIVMMQDPDPVGNGFVASLARPGGNITGLSTHAPEISGKQLEILKETVPKLSRVATLGTSTSPGYALSLKEMELAAEVLGVKLQHVDMPINPNEIETAFRAASKGRADALVVLGGAVVGSQPANSRAGGKEPGPGDVLQSRFCRSWRAHDVCCKFAANAPTTDSLRAKAVRQVLIELGYVEGQNIAVEYRYAEGKLDRLPELVAELVRLKVDVIVAAGGDTVILPAKQATKTIPIVMTGSGSDPVKAGFIESLARPGGNVTGITSFSTELGGKRFELIKEAFPKTARVAVIYDPAAPGSVREVKEDLPIVARALGLTVQPWEVRSADRLDKVFAALIKERADTLYMRSGGPALRSDMEQRIVEFTLKRKMPSLFTNRRAIDVGGLMYYGADVADNNRRVAIYVDKILKGAKPADLPVEQPMKFEFVINLKTAKQIGVTINPEVLARATRIIR